MARQSQNGRINDEAAFVIQTWPWKETSLLVEMLTLNHGKVVMVARGAKRPGCQFRGLLSPFLPLKVSYWGTNEVKTLAKVSWLGGFIPLQGDALFSGFYVNELLARLLPREDCIEPLFASYVNVLKALADEKNEHEKALRLFEADLLSDLGWALPASEQCLWAWVDNEFRVVESVRDLPETAVPVLPRVLDEMNRRDFTRPETLMTAKRLFRAMIAHYAGDKPLNTRRILQELKRL